MIYLSQLSWCAFALVGEPDQGRTAFLEILETVANFSPHPGAAPAGRASQAQARAAQRLLVFDALRVRRPRSASI